MEKRQKRGEGERNESERGGREGQSLYGRKMEREG